MDQLAHNRDPTSTSSSTSSSTGADVLLWLTVAFAFSLQLADLITHWWNSPWYRYSLVFIPLSIHCIWKAGRVRARRPLGLVLIAASLAVAAVTSMGNMIPLGRPAMAIGLIGLLLLQGRASLARASLVLWVVPVPHQLVFRLSGVESAEFLFGVCGGLFSMWGGDVVLRDGIVLAGSAQLPIEAAYGGLPVLIQMMGLGWYLALRGDRPAAASARIVLIAALLTPLIQIVSIVSALIVLMTFGGTPAAAFMGHMPWVMPLVAIAIYGDKWAGGQNAPGAQPKSPSNVLRP